MTIFKSEIAQKNSSDECFRNGVIGETKCAAKNLLKYYKSIIGLYITIIKKWLLLR